MTPVNSLNGSTGVAAFLPASAVSQSAASPGGLTFSRHAQERMQQESQVLSDQDVSRIQNGVDKAAAKGSRDSLVLLDNHAFVVDVKNRTVITSISAARLQESNKVFTNIDSTVFA